MLNDWKTRLKAELADGFAFENICLQKMVPDDYARAVDLCVYDGKWAATEAEAREIGERIEADFSAGNSIHWTIYEREDERIRGTIGFYRGFANSTGEIGYIVRPEYRRNHY